MNIQRIIEKLSQVVVLARHQRFEAVITLDLLLKDKKLFLKDMEITPFVDASVLDEYLREFEDGDTFSEDFEVEIKAEVFPGKPAYHNNPPEPSYANLQEVMMGPVTKEVNILKYLDEDVKEELLEAAIGRAEYEEDHKDEIKQEMMMDQWEE